MRLVRPTLRAPCVALLLLLVLATPSGAQVQPCPDPPPLYPPTQVHLIPNRPCPDQDVRLFFATCGPCWDIVNVVQDPGAITVTTHQRPDSCILRICLPESASVALGRFAPGLHSVVVRRITIYGSFDGQDSTYCSKTNLDTLRFTVANTCTTGLPFVKEVFIGPNTCVGCPPKLCAGDSIPVRIRGEFPDDCMAFVGAELLPNPSAGPLPQPPIVRLYYETNGCLGRPCNLTPVPWEIYVNLPPLPVVSHVYWLPIETALVHAPCPPTPRDTSVTGEALFPFAISEPCSVSAPPCFLASFGDSASNGDCDDYVGPDRFSHVYFRIGSGVPLYGLEGEFAFDSPHLRVDGMETFGPAVGMRLVWQTTPSGARFVLYSEGNAHIPAAPPWPYSGHLPILNIRVAMRSLDSLPPPRIRMFAHRLVAADEHGHGVEDCPRIEMVYPISPHATFCTNATCDFDRNGSTDVRDLVRMVRCLNDPSRCDPGPLDCDRSGFFSLDDVLCCAYVLLGVSPRDTTGGRPDPSLRVRFGAPVEDHGVIAIPVTLEGANPVAAARLALRYPSGRFDVAGVDFPGSSTWLRLHEVREGRVVVGLLDLGGEPSAAFHHSFTLRLALRPGQRPGGAVEVESAQFSDPAGVALVAELGAPSITLGGARLALGPGRPNPFAREVRFDVTLAERSDLEITIHDLTGRLVATLHRGVATPGVHPFRWDGRSAGGLAPDGIYFARVRSGADVKSRKIVLIREP